MQQRAAGWTQTQAYDSPTIKHMVVCSPNELNQPLYKFKMLVCSGKSKKK